MTCDYCGVFIPQMGEWEYLTCVHCTKKFGICAHHKTYRVAYHGDAYGQLIGPVCPTCIGWDAATRKYRSKGCLFCKAGFDPLDDDAFTEQQKKTFASSKDPKALLWNDPKRYAGDYKDAAPIDQGQLDAILALKRASTASAARGPVFQALSQEAATVVLDAKTEKTLRLMSWNIQDLGGGFKGLRSKAVIDSIATIIHNADPHVCVVIEVLKRKGIPIRKKKVRKRKKKGNRAAATPPLVAPKVTHEVPGIAEVEKIVAALKTLGNRWVYKTHPKLECTGGSGSETYAYLYKDDGNISVDDATILYVTKDDKGGDLHFPGATNRRPMQAVFTLKKDLRSNGAEWKLPIVAFHAPAQHGKGDGTDIVPMQALENLSRMSLVDPTDAKYKTGNEFVDYAIAADLNINFDYDSGVADDGNALMVKRSKYVEAAEKVLAEMYVNNIVGQEIFGRGTTLKQVSHHFQIEDYEEHEEWMDPENYIPDEAVQRLYLHYAKDKTGNEYKAGVKEFVETYYDVPSDQKEAAALHEELAKDVGWAMSYIDAEKNAGGKGVPSSTSAYCTNSFDKLVLVQKWDAKEDAPVAACIVKDAKACVLPLLAAVMPQTTLDASFRGRNPSAEYEGMYDPAKFESTLYALLEPEYKKVGGDDFKDAIDPAMCLKVANRISDHLPVVLHLKFK